MQRPVMNPTFFDETPVIQRPAGRRIPIKRLLRWLVCLLLSHPLRRRRQEVSSDAGPLSSRIMRGLLYRLILLPFLIVSLVVVLVLWGTHPIPIRMDVDPGSEGIYYDPVRFLSEDGTALEAWLIPAIDERMVLCRKEAVLRQKQAAVVLLHDYGLTRQQMLPLVRPLHQQGLVLLVLGLRGDGTGAVVGQTFGLNESLDIRAGVEMLRRRSYIDPKRIAVLGIGTGASASLLAAESDPRLAALVLENPVRCFDDMSALHLTPQNRLLGWMAPLCKWTFEAIYQVDSDRLNLDRFSRLITSRPTLMMNASSGGSDILRPCNVQRVCRFLRQSLLAGDDLASGQ